MNFSGISSRTIIGQVLRFPLKMIPVTTVVPIIQGPLRGKRWIVGSSNHGCWLGSYEFEKQQQFVKHIRKGDIVYDIGAHVGFYTLLSSHLTGNQGHVVAFEPFTPNMRFLSDHMTLNKVKNVTLVAKAVSDYTGQTFFDVSESSSMGHLLMGKTSTKTITVDVIALDQYIAEAQLPLPDVLKVDIEGDEFRFLKGSQQLLESRALKIFLATHGHEVHKKCLGFLREIGYQISSLEDKPVELCSEILAMRSDIAPKQAPMP